MTVMESNGITTWYEVVGSGPPLLMFSPGGFNATLDNWSALGRYKQLQMVSHLSQHYACILFDRRESGRSGGRVERVGWDSYVSQGADLLDELGIDRAHLMGGCAGCSVAVAFAVTRPASTLSMTLFSPAGGVRYRISQHARFGRHLAYVADHGLDGVVKLAADTGVPFSSDPRVGPWGPVLARDAAFAERFAAADPARYTRTVVGLARLMFDRDTVCGAEPEDLMRLDVPALVIPGHDDSHATSAARYLEECLQGSEYWDVPVPEQTEERVNARVLEFLAAQSKA
ncbi:MAG: alpha/beta fold hydrolase [Acidimicrobiales bacterium]